MIREGWVPDRAEICGWIEAILARGVRRPGSEADRWTEAFCAERCRELGLERVRLEPVQVAGWDPRAWSLRARAGDGERELECFPAPFSAPCDELELPLVAWDPANPSAVAAAAALYDVALLRVPPAFVAGGDAARVFDPGHTFEGSTQVLPFGPEIMRVMEPAIAAGARAFLEAHAAELPRIVLELHLESAGRLAPTGRCEPRWFFTREIPELRSAVRDALEGESLERSLVLRPDALGPTPTTDAGFFHAAGVPLLNFLTAPFYLFDGMDELDKVDAESLVPLTRWAIRVIGSTRGRSAAEMRAGAR